MTDTLRFRIPIRIVSVANAREHWAKKAKRAQHHRGVALMASRAMLRPTARRLAENPEARIVVIITRVAPRKLDTDNLASGCKSTRDGLADALGIDDGSDRVEWRYAQQKGGKGEYAVVVSVEAVGQPATDAVQPRQPPRIPREIQ